MTLGRLILTNSRRHRVRSLIGAAGIAFGVAAMLTVLSVVLGAISMFQRILQSDSHYLVFERNVSDLFFSSVDTAALDQIRARPEVEAAEPILFGIVSSEDKPVITCFGLDPTDPRLDRARWLAGERANFTADDGHVYLGSRAAAFLGAHLGDPLPVGRETMEVGGILQMANGFEDGGLFLPLARAQAFFHREGYASIIAAKLVDPDTGEAFAAAVNAQFPGLIALKNEEFAQSYSQFRILSATAWAVGICAFLLGGMGVANTMLMAVFSRVREIAILRVTGFSRPQVATMILGESLLLALVGSIGGFGLGYLALFWMERAPQLNGYVQPVVHGPILAGIVAVAFFTSLGGALYPAWYATRIQPAEALRYE